MIYPHVASLPPDPNGSPWMVVGAVALGLAVAAVLLLACAPSTSTPHDAGWQSVTVPSGWDAGGGGK